MANEGFVTLTMHDLERLKILERIREKRMKQSEAAALLGLSIRQVQRLLERLAKRGPAGLTHGLRGRRSNRRVPAALIEQALKLVQMRYSDFGPTFAWEKLLERHGLVLGRNTLRRAMIQAGLCRPKRRKPRHRSWRRRRDCVGMLVQLDGSEHRWFEDRGPKCALIAFVDDATSKLLWAEFFKVEDTLSLMRATRSYLLRHGRPQAFYVDKDSIYRTNRAASVEEELRDAFPSTQFSRAMSELEVQMIFAHSPQAKGRVERGFRTHQNRLVKELRLAGVSSMDEANRFLAQVYLREHNRRFALPAASPSNAHRPLLADHRLEKILSLREERTLGNDFTLRHQNAFYQLLEEQPVKIRPGAKVDVETRLDGATHLRFRGAYLAYKTVPKRLYRPFYQAQPSATKQYPDPNFKGVGSTPKGHPWRMFFDKKPYAGKNVAIEMQAYSLE